MSKLSDLEKFSLSPNLHSPSLAVWLILIGTPSSRSAHVKRMGLGRSGRLKDRDWA